MKKLSPIVLSIAILVLASSPVGAQSIHWQTDIETASQLATKQNKLILLHFTAQWCRPCKSLDTFVFSNIQVLRSMDDNVVPVRIDVDQNPELAKEYGISGVPFDVVTTPAGRIVGKRTSPRDSAAYAHMINGYSKVINAIEAGNPALDQNLDDFKDQIYSDNQIVENKSIVPRPPSHTAPGASNESNDLKRRGKIVNPFAKAAPENAQPAPAPARNSQFAQAESKQETGPEPANVQNDFFAESAEPGTITDASKRTTAPLAMAQPEQESKAASVHVKNDFFVSNDASTDAQPASEFDAGQSQPGSEMAALQPKQTNDVASFQPTGTNQAFSNPSDTDNQLLAESEFKPVTMVEPSGIQRLTENIPVQVDLAAAQAASSSAAVWDQPNSKTPARLNQETVSKMAQSSDLDIRERSDLLRDFPTEIPQKVGASRSETEFVNAQPVLPKPQPSLGELKSLLERSTPKIEAAIAKSNQSRANARLVLPQSETVEPNSEALAEDNQFAPPTQAESVQAQIVVAPATVPKSEIVQPKFESVQAQIVVAPATVPKSEIVQPKFESVHTQIVVAPATVPKSEIVQPKSESVHTQIVVAPATLPNQVADLLATPVEPAQTEHPAITPPASGGARSGVNSEIVQSGPRPNLPPNVALKGKCPVSLLKIGAWVDGDPQWGCVHRDRTYLFASEANLREFQNDPDAFSPLLAGFDPVIFHKQGELVEGLEEHGVFMGRSPQQRVVLFSSAETRAEFQANPRTYINTIRQAMQNSGGSSSNLLR